MQFVPFIESHVHFSQMLKKLKGPFKRSGNELVNDTTTVVQTIQTRSDPKTHFYAFAMYDFEATDPDDLSFRRGDLLRVCRSRTLNSKIGTENI